MISVLIPSRVRPQFLRDSILSLKDTATYPDKLEFLIYLDDDDSSLAKYKEELDPLARWTRIWIAERYGYARLHECYNFLARESRGDWLWLWNDDARINKIGWDEQIYVLPTDEPIAISFTGRGNWFPMINRCYYDVVGHFSLQGCSDTFIEWASQRAQVDHYINDFGVAHLRYLQDETMAGRNKDQPIISQEFYKPETQALIMEDVAKLVKWKIQHKL